MKYKNQFIKHNGIYNVLYPDANFSNRIILAKFLRFNHHSDVKKTHHFHGRYENIYIDTSYIPELLPILKFTINCAAHILNISPEELKYGFWFNAMMPGHITIPHTHDDDDERLSATYYIDVPENSGDFHLIHDKKEYSVSPKSGLLLLFSPKEMHHVTENKSKQLRLSIGINIGCCSNPI